MQTPPANPTPIANYAIATIGTIAIVRSASASMEPINFWESMISDWEQIADHLRAIGATHWRSIDPDESISPLAAL